MSPFRSLALLFAILCTCVAGCATDFSWQASIALSGPVGGMCVMAALDAERDVFDVVRTGSDSVAFRLSLDGVKRDDWPSFSAKVSNDLDGTPTLELSTGYSEGLFERDSNAQLLRARALVTRITEECTGREPTLGEPKPCGAGELRDLCVKGH